MNRKAPVAMQPVMDNPPGLLPAVTVNRGGVGGTCNRAFIGKFAWYMVERRATLARKGK